MNTRIRTAALTTVTAAAVVVGGIAASAPAEAKGRVVRAAAHCTTTHTVGALKAKSSNGRIEVEFEVDSNRNGQRWTYTLRRNGVLQASGARLTLAPSGSFTVARLITNAAGVDRIVAVARNARTGEVCSAAVRY
jgi:outer membrane lipoprotein SlyB